MDPKKAAEEAKEELKSRAKDLVLVHDNGRNADIMDSGRFAQLQRVAQLFAASKLVPDSFRGDMASTFVACQLAMRMDVDPFMMLQNMYVVHGKPGIQAQLMISLANTRGPFSGPIQWELSGEGMKRKCAAYATHKVTGEVCRAEISMEVAKAEGWLDKPGSKWKTMPDLMLRYRSAAFLVRLYCPEVVMGMYTAEELQDIEQQPPKRVQIVSSRSVDDVDDDVPKSFGPKVRPPVPEQAQEPKPEPTVVAEQEPTGAAEQNPTGAAEQNPTGAAEPEPTQNADPDATKGPSKEPEPTPAAATDSHDSERRRAQALGVLRQAAALKGYARDDTELLNLVRGMLIRERVETLNALSEKQIMSILDKFDRSHGRGRGRGNRD